MALVKATLAKDVHDAMNSGQGSQDAGAQWRMCNALALAIYNYLLTATVKTTLDPTCMASGGANASTTSPSPGPITAPATASGTTTGTLS